MALRNDGSLHSRGGHATHATWFVRSWSSESKTDLISLSLLMPLSERILRNSSIEMNPEEWVSMAENAAERSCSSDVPAGEARSVPRRGWRQRG